MSPRPLPDSFAGPSPRSRCTEPDFVPRATFRRLVPLSVGTSMIPPSRASGIVSGTSTSRLSPLRLNTEDSATRVITYRSPGSAPRSPGSPLPARRMRVPSLTPAGMFARNRRIVRCAPLPWQVGHGSSITVPWPWQLEQGWDIEKIPWLCASMPVPLHTGHTRGEVPGLAPVPLHVGHGWEVGTVSDTWAPLTAWSNVSETSVSRSRPRAGRCCAPRTEPVSPPVRAPLNRLERMSPKPPLKELGSKPAPPAAAFANWPNGVPARSYCLRLSGSESTSCAWEISLKRSSAFLSPWLVSGWYLRASLRYALRISSSEAFLP